MNDLHSEEPLPTDRAGTEHVPIRLGDGVTVEGQPDPDRDTPYASKWGRRYRQRDAQMPHPRKWPSVAAFYQRMCPECGVMCGGMEGAQLHIRREHQDRGDTIMAWLDDLAAELEDARDTLTGGVLTRAPRVWGPDQLRTRPYTKRRPLFGSWREIGRAIWRGRDYDREQTNGDPAGIPDNRVADQRRSPEGEAAAGGQAAPAAAPESPGVGSVGEPAARPAGGPGPAPAGRETGPGPGSAPVRLGGGALDGDALELPAAGPASPGVDPDPGDAAALPAADDGDDSLRWDEIDAPSPLILGPGATLTTEQIDARVAQLAEIRAKYERVIGQKSGETEGNRG